MSDLFLIEWPIIILLGAVAVVATVQTLRYTRANRRLLASLQIPCAMLLAFALLLREHANESTLLVLTAGAETESLTAQADEYVALPGAPTPQATQHPRIAVAPDLATALRRHPDIKHVHVIGSGLETHDREVLGERDFSFAPSVGESNARPAIIALELPSLVAAGQWWQVSGRVSTGDVSVELRDPSGEVIAVSPSDEKGHFELQTIARASGPVIYTLQLLDAEGVEMANTSPMPLPINAMPRKAMRALLLAAVPTPELKYLRRWAADAGVELDSRIGLAPGLVQGRAGLTLDAAMLDQLDLLIADERSWPQITRHRDAVRLAVSNGLGLLIRITGPVPKNIADEMKLLGVALTANAKEPNEIVISDMQGKLDNRVLHAWPLIPADTASEISPAIYADRGPSVNLINSVSGQTIATQHLLGQGRIGVIGLLDSFRLYTRGERERHATLWSRLFQQIARARGESDVDLPTHAIIGQRTVLCGLAKPTKLTAPDQAEIPLSIDPQSGNCAAFWPRAAGWHHVKTDGADSAADKKTPGPQIDSTLSENQTNVEQAFYVFDAKTVSALLDVQRRDATAALVNQTDKPVTSALLDSEAWRRTVLLVWLTLMAASWWLERRARRLGMANKAIAYP